MNPWTALIGAIPIPPWYGEKRTHRLDDGPTQNQAQRWTPWTLLVPGVMLPNRVAMARVWALIGSRA